MLIMILNNISTYKQLNHCFTTLQIYCDGIECIIQRMYLLYLHIYRYISIIISRINYQDSLIKGMLQEMRLLLETCIIIFCKTRRKSNIKQKHIIIGDIVLN